MKKSLKSKVKKHLKRIDEECKLEGNEQYIPKLFGESKSVAFTVKGISGEEFCQTTEWANGEGYDFHFQCKDNEKSISLHFDQIHIMLTGLKKLGYFN
jgi:hypothetical protein